MWFVGVVNMSAWNRTSVLFVGFCRAEVKEHVEI